MDNRIGEMELFLRVVESGSFSKAAQLTRTTPSTVSKLISRIEARLGVRLIERSTRQLAVTPEGQQFYDRAQTLLNDLYDMERSLRTGTAQLQGVVRINTSVAFGTLALEPLLPAFWQAYPDIQIDLSLSDAMTDLYLERTDIAFRVGKLQDSSLTARFIGAAQRHIVASPTYLAQHGMPATLEDLDQHACLGFNFRRNTPVWPLKSSGRVVERSIRGPLLANNGESVRRMALAGMGLAHLADFHIRSDLQANRLVEVLPDIGRDSEDIHAVFPGSRNVPQRVRVFLDFTLPRLKRFLKN
ncbi:LysR family transcriptional regulator [Acetobacter indonesiensis]|uniref:LysR family transcriptional regulator n=1 Tax=Acetobacter indonesiensis TaxID=104101 RepID=UPI001F3C24AA|nr:LysR family transcriptional regulator [Acetobacter indonesiensis]MCG0993797.1 LysR family transcriptional regulator [Acetobacter indonesiensis]